MMIIHIGYSLIAYLYSCLVLMAHLGSWSMFCG